MTKKVSKISRSKAGRKKLADKKVTVNLYIYESTISTFGGLDGLKNWLYNSIDSEIISLN